MRVVTKVIKTGVGQRVRRAINRVADVMLAIDIPKDTGLKGDRLKMRDQHLLLLIVSYQRNNSLPNRLAANFQSHSISVLRFTMFEQERRIPV